MSGDILAQVMRREKYREWKASKSDENERRRPTSSRRRGSRNDREDDSQVKLGSYSGTESPSEA